MKKVAMILISLLFIVSGFAGVPSVQAQASNDVTVTDGTNDVEVAPGSNNPYRKSPPDPTAAPYPEPFSGPMDLTGFKVSGETATSLNFELSIADFTRPNTWHPGSMYYFLCFEYAGEMYRFLLQGSFGLEPNPTPTLEFATGSLQRMAAGECRIEVPNHGTHIASTLGAHHWRVTVDEDAGTFSWTFARKLFAVLDAEERFPAAGDTLANLQAFALSEGPGYTFVTYDETDSQTFTFDVDTGNDKVRVVVPSTIRTGSAGLERTNMPLYGVEIGSFQTIPLTIENYLEVPIEPSIAVSIITGEESKWQVRTLSSIPVPARISEEEPGRATVTLVVSADPTVKHKESVRVMATAVDEANPHLGAIAVDVLAVDPPTPSKRTMYFHGTGSSCGNAQQSRWMNTLQSDNKAPGYRVAFRSCEPNAAGGNPTAMFFGTGRGFVFHPDVPLSRDYTFSTNEPARAEISLQSVRHIGVDEVGVPMVVDVTVQILSGGTLIGDKTEKNLEIGGDPKAIPVDVDILPRMLGGFGRDVPDNKGIGVRVFVEPASRVLEIGGCVQGQCTPEDERQVPSANGDIYMLFGQSKVELPIVSSERSGDIINITASGALITLRLAEGERQVFTNPGKIVVFNVTVQNEGVNIDTAKLEARLNNTNGWRAEIFPNDRFDLDVGEARTFNVRVSAPPDSREGDSVRLSLHATSLNDPEATARLVTTVEVTTGQQFDNQELDPNHIPSDEEDSPAPTFLVAFAVLALLGGAMRRRR